MEISEGLERLFDVEIANEDVGYGNRSGSCSEGGANPATLGSCLDSLEQGLELEEDGFDTNEVTDELQRLIAKYNADKEVRDFIEE